MNGQQRCNHWNDRIDPAGKKLLRPIRCLLAWGHAGPHQCGNTSWGEALGYRDGDS